VCSPCWFEEDRTNTPYGDAEDLECAKNGIPTVLAVKQAGGEGFTFYLLEDGRFKKQDQHWLAYTGKRAEITGAVSAKKGKQYLKVDALNVLSSPDEAPARPEANVIGAEVELAPTDLSGVEQRLSAFRGRIVVLNSWATWCGPCRQRAGFRLIARSQRPGTLEACVPRVG
jgi:hypothetical protein